MSVFSYVIIYFGAALEALLLWRLLRGGTWRVYPSFFVFVLYIVAQNAALFAIFQLAPNSYALWYWRTGIVHVCLRFLVIWEVFRHTFPKPSPLRRMVSRQFTVATLALITVLTGMLWAVQAYGKFHSVYLAMERSFGFVQAVLILAILIVARYYHLRIGRNIWGIAVAFGMYSSLSTAVSAFIDLMHSYFPYWQLLAPLSFVAMLGMWTWAVWVYAPNKTADGDEMLDPANDLRRWAEDWGRTVSTVRKVMHP